MDRQKLLMHANIHVFGKWRLARLEMEERQLLRRTRWSYRIRLWLLFKTLVRTFGMVLRLAGVYATGRRNASQIELTERVLHFENLPPAFDGYRILHITDPHFDRVPEIVPRLKELVTGLKVNLALFTGDYRPNYRRGYRESMELMKEVVSCVHASDGMVATLGNHDTAQMVDMLAAMGIEVLANDTIAIARGDQKIFLTGVDDVYYYYTPAAVGALSNLHQGFKILALHSAHLVERAADAGYSLFIAGHTHGGQICLPGGMPLITHGVRRRFVSGLWRYRDLQGFTSRGAGVSGLNARFNCPGEISVLILKKR